MARRGEVLVVIVNNRQDMAIAREKHWYRVPVESVEKTLKKYWAPEWLAFYQTSVFQDEAYTIRYYARVLDIQTVQRQVLFPDEVEHEKSQKQYYRLEIASLERLTQPIISSRRRRITFIPTTLSQLRAAVEIGDLYRVDH